MKHEALMTLTGAFSQNGMDVARETEGRGGGGGHDAGDQQGAAGEPASCARGQALPHHHQGGLMLHCCYAGCFIKIKIVIDLWLCFCRCLCKMYMKHI